MGNEGQEIADRMDPARAEALHAALGREGPAPGMGDPLPPFWHQIYFWDPKPPEALGRDGHTRTGGLIPDLGLPRRMWAGGRLVWHGTLRAGVRAVRSTRVQSVTRKEGRTGTLGFVVLRHEIRQRGALVLSEDQQLVYRPDNAPTARPPDAPGVPEAVEVAGFDATMLFRYSALTLNGHRIHYDAPYARDVEGYPGLVVHGPLLATLLMEMAERREGTLRQFSFRATAPLCLPEGARICARGRDYWVQGEGGRVCMVGTTEG